MQCSYIRKKICAILSRLQACKSLPSGERLEEKLRSSGGHGYEDDGANGGGSSGRDVRQAIALRDRIIGAAAV